MQKVDESVAVPLERELVSDAIAAARVDLARASIREMNNLVNRIERRTGVRFLRMEFGIPGLPTPRVAIEAEHRALSEAGVGATYAPFEGIPELKEEASRFADLFMGLELSPECCAPTVGAMEGCFAAMLLASKLKRHAGTVLFLDPGFSVNRLQLRMLGLEAATIDFHEHRGDDLLRAIHERLARRDVCAMIWSSPNNPSWIALRESELRGIAAACEEHGVLAIEDLAYFGMDTRHDYLEPGKPPYQPTVLRYTHRAISIVSSSKLFSYAGQRIALSFMRPELLRHETPNLVPSLGTARVGHAFLHGCLYPITASVPQSPQHGLTALLRAANDGDRTVFSAVDEYSRRARAMKKLFAAHDFRLVYDNDLGEPLADGFYFTISYPGFDHGADLLRELLAYGISAITLETTGSSRVEGLRACVSMVAPERFDELDARLRAFRRDHPPA